MKSLRTLLGLMLLLMACAAHAEQPPKNLPEGGRIAEGHVLSIQYTGTRSASIVVRPCDAGISCANIIARLTSKTEIRDDGKLINLEQTKKVDWKMALLVTDKFNNALLINRIPTSSRR